MKGGESYKFQERCEDEQKMMHKQIFGGLPPEEKRADLEVTGMNMPKMHPIYVCMT